MRRLPCPSIQRDGRREVPEPRLDLRRPGLAGLRAEPGAGQARRDARAPQRRPELVAQVERGGEDADEGIARAGGIHRVHRQGARPHGGLRTDRQRPGGAEGHDAGQVVRGRQIARERRDLGAARATGGHAPLDLVHHEHVEHAQNLGRHRPGRREVQNRPRPARLGALDQRASRFGPHLVLTQHGDAGGELAIRYLAGIRVEIGAARHDDLILRALIDADHRDSGRPARSGDGGAVDPGRGHRLAREAAEAVVADMADHAHGSAGAGRRGGLVGALAAGGQLVARTQHRLARAGQALDLEQQVYVDRAEHQEHARFSQFRRLPNSASGELATWSHRALCVPRLPRPRLRHYAQAA